MNHKPISNFVLIKPNLNHEEITMESGTKLYVNMEYDTEKLAPTTGEVVDVPFYLHFEQGSQYSLESDAEMELKVGDQVFFHFLTHKECNSRGMILKDDDGHPLYLVSYDKFFVAKRGEEIVPLNGWIIVEPIKGERVTSSTIDIPDIINTNPSAKFGKVAYMGKPVKEYLHEPNTYTGVDNLKVGDIICFSKNSDRTIQYDIFNDFSTKKYFRMEARDIEAIIPEEIFHLVNFE